MANKYARLLLEIAALLLVAAISILGTLSSIRPTPPDLSDQQEWTLIKIYRDSESQILIRVYILKHLSGKWDPYTIEQNKIIASQADNKIEFMWPRDNEFAGGWCEVARLPNHEVAILLFDDIFGLRIVLFENSHFLFRSDKDELIAASEIKWQGIDSKGELSFNVMEAGKARLIKWTPQFGFARENLGNHADR